MYVLHEHTHQDQNSDFRMWSLGCSHRPDSSPVGLPELLLSSSDFLPFLKCKCHSKHLTWHLASLPEGFLKHFKGLKCACSSGHKNTCNTGADVEQATKRRILAVLHSLITGTL